MNPNYDSLPEMPGDLGKLFREIQENPDARSLMQSLIILPDISALRYDERRARLAPDSIVQMLLYEATDDPSLRDQFVALLLDGYEPPSPQS